MDQVPSEQDQAKNLLRSTGLERLPEADRHFLLEQTERYRFTQQELRQLGDMVLDLNMWDAPSIQSIWPSRPTPGLSPKQTRQQLLGAVRAHWQGLKEGTKSYPAPFTESGYAPERIKRVNVERSRLGLGSCPVASPRTRCCNLLTLDAVENCGFDCSYCSIQSFYHGDEVRFDSGFADKLRNLEIDPKRIYHIGTGQSSDSLMWGNQAGILDALLAFAERHPNVILELKSKSKNIAHLLKNSVPPNVICTWSLNTPTLIGNEEHLTASLDERLNAARRLADKGVVVGFHFHPMIHYERWREDYGEIFRRITEGFGPDEVALVSLGTLTYIKPVIKQLRARPGFKSKILQMPMVEADGKLSYPDEIKLAMFRFAYDSLAAWHDKVFFYLCMENQRLWQPVFGFDFASNADFEDAMKTSYMKKIDQRRQVQDG
jgi:spore photoproduct lyase